jgi:hypothetical protein
VQCQRAEGEVLEAYFGEIGPVWLHRDCEAAWEAGEIPDFLDRRDEVST